MSLPDLVRILTSLSKDPAPTILPNGITLRVASWGKKAAWATALTSAFQI